MEPLKCLNVSLQTCLRCISYSIFAVHSVHLVFTNLKTLKNCPCVTSRTSLHWAEGGAEALFMGLFFLNMEKMSSSACVWVKCNWTQVYVIPSGRGEGERLSIYPADVMWVWQAAPLSVMKTGLQLMLLICWLMAGPDKSSFYSSWTITDPSAQIQLEWTNGAIIPAFLSSWLALKNSLILAVWPTFLTLLTYEVCGPIVFHLEFLVYFTVLLVLLDTCFYIHVYTNKQIQINKYINK